MPYSYLSYSDDFILDEAPKVYKPGKKLISFPQTQHIQGTIRVKGNTRLPLDKEQIVVRASAFESTSQLISYNGIVNTVGEGTITGSTLRNVKSKAMFIGSKLNNISESVTIKGKKDFVVLINKLEQVLDLQEDYDNYDWQDKVQEAKYQGRTVKLNKPFRTSGGPKKFAVYVMNKQGNVVIVRFGDPNMSIKRDDPERRKSFRARHNCSQKKDRTTPGYWSCKFWSSKKVGDLA